MVVNAGIVVVKGLLDTAVQDWDRLFSVCLALDA